MSTILALGGWLAVRREAIAANRVIRPAPTMRAAISGRTPVMGDQTVSEVSGLADTRRRWIGVDLRRRLRGQRSQDRHNTAKNGRESSCRNNPVRFRTAGEVNDSWGCFDVFVTSCGREPIANFAWGLTHQRVAAAILAVVATLVVAPSAFAAGAPAGKEPVGAPLVGVPTQHHAGARSLIRGAALAPGFNSFELPANDDGSTAEIKLPFKVNYFGKTYGGVYVNNNWNLTFGASQSQYTPQPLGSITLPMIAPFWADVDTRVGNVVTYGSGTVELNKAFGVNWPGVGCYAERDATTNTFQVLLISRSDIGTGDFDIEFNYGPIEWESGQASGGNESCLEGVPARAGYASGTGLAYELPGSGVANALLSSSPTTGSRCRTRATAAHSPARRVYRAWRLAESCGVSALRRARRLILRGRGSGSSATGQRRCAQSLRSLALRLRAVACEWCALHADRVRRLFRRDHGRLLDTEPRGQQERSE